MTHSDVDQASTLDYRSPSVRRSKLARAALVLGLIAAVTSIVVVGVVPGFAAIVVGVIASTRIQRRADILGGMRAARAGVALGCVGCVVGVGVAVLMPCSCGNRGLSNRFYCAANMRGIAQSMSVYAADNADMFPILPFAAYGALNSGPSLDVAAGHAASTPTTSAPSPAISLLFKPSGPLNGSPLAAEWLLVQLSYCAPKQFLCKSDAYASATPSSLTDAAGNTFLNFQQANQLSYAFAYPYAPDGTPGNWWKNTTDSSLPVAADMPPKNGTRAPARNVSPGAVPKDPRSWNSPNHSFEGQNVAFADGHAEFVRRPDIGQHDDNIFTYTGTKSISQFGGTQPGPTPITINTDAAPYDIVLVPARDLKTGATY